ncbi:MAG: DUF4291 domain-containing protein [Planctomycetes bacterium]|nr:DUF4291 domain-containing protein [Planctomycetota bacterium]
MTPERQIRADFDRETIVVYQAYSPAIADAALAAGRFVAPFSLTRMTWIKPSFLWLMERSGYASKPGQERILAVRITRAGWDGALEQAALSSYTPGLHASPEAWSETLHASAVRVQWDPERSLRGAKLTQRSIQVGLGRAIVPAYVQEWLVELRDLTPLARKLAALRKAGRHSEAQALLPPERPYPATAAARRRLGMDEV